MALAFAHVECGYVTTLPSGAEGPFGVLEWSETMALAGQCLRPVPTLASQSSNAPQNGTLTLEVSAGALDLYVSQAFSAPNAGSGSGSGVNARQIVRAGETKRIPAIRGALVAVAAGDGSSGGSGGTGGGSTGGLNPIVAALIFG